MFSPIVEPGPARNLRRSLAEAEPASLWNRDDLTYLGDLSWCELPTNGHEYIADWGRQGDQFHYTYALINVDESGQLVGGMVFPVRGPLDGSGRFEMLMNDTWLEGPLRMWLDQLAPHVQGRAVERYRAVISWVSDQLASSG